MYKSTHNGLSATKKKVISLALCAAVTASAFAVIGLTSSNSVSAADYGLADNIQDGTILHCFDWKYSDIKAELPAIAQAGFTSIQTSPVQPAAGKGPWYWLYQPLGFSVGTDLGTKDELKDLCTAADEYGIKVIVDVVANHLAGDHKSIQDDLKPDEFWHTYGPIKSDSDRKQVTQGDLDMKDLNSENTYVQQVVKNYVLELKSLGVDGIRWDAAKHIATPIEGCDFWKVVTDTGLYNYGEILNGPMDGGDGTDIMKDYTKYMSVTDNTYGNSILSSLNKGTAPNFDGNWTLEGLSSSKLVYWGESHDTYSNAEGKDSNAVSQNIVDRAYAVVAARSDASSLYFSRPEAKAKDSIRIGVKGSRQFASDEVAAVNRFHNAMIGKADAYGVSDNCSVVTRQGGGAVIVCGSGESKTVTVDNVNGYVPSGTYVDDVSGGQFVVTEKTIVGYVGETGIAVINPTVTPRISASKVSGTKFDDSLKITLTAIGMTASHVTTSDGTSADYSNGDSITIGQNAEPGSEITVALSGTTVDGAGISTTYVYQKNENKKYPTLLRGGVVFDNTQAGWDTVNVYVYDEITTSTTVTNGDWPGVKMTDCGNGLFMYELPEQFKPCKNIMIIFNNGTGDQIPGQMQAGLTMTYTDRKLYDGTKWVDLPNQPLIPIESSVESSTESSTESSVESSADSSKESSEQSQQSSQQSKEETSKNESSKSATAQSKPTTAAASSTAGTVTTDGTVSTADGSFATVIALAMITLASAFIGYLVLRKKKDNE